MRLILRFVFLAAALCFLASCATSPRGISREQMMYSYGTNGVAWAQQVLVPYVPPPYHEAALAFLGLVSAGLGLWNRSQQKRLTALENGGPSPGTPPAPQGHPPPRTQDPTGDGLG